MVNLLDFLEPNFFYRYVMEEIIFPFLTVVGFPPSGELLRTLWLP
jgi:hypothetical protein